MMDEEIRQALTEVREMKKMCGNINMKLTNIVTQRGQDIKKKLDAEYQRGLNDAWKLAEDVLYNRGNVLDILRCATVGAAFDKYSAGQALDILKAYEEKQKADDKIEVGDEVNWLGDCFIVTRIFQPRNMKEQCDGIDDDGCVCHGVLMDDLEKTGRHFDIASILEDMRND